MDGGHFTLRTHCIGIKGEETAFFTIRNGAEGAKLRFEANVGQAEGEEMAHFAKRNGAGWCGILRFEAILTDDPFFSLKMKKAPMADGDGRFLKFWRTVGGLRVRESLR